jgi:hypothetical protein
LIAKLNKAYSSSTGIAIGATKPQDYIVSNRKEGFCTIGAKIELERFLRNLNKTPYEHTSRSKAEDSRVR